MKQTLPPPTEIDPVCGMSVSPEQAAGTYQYSGKDYFFCSKGCLEKFRSSPDKYVHHERHASVTSKFVVTESPQKSDVIYTCPMHPEVRQRGLGACPKCGMALEPEMPAADEDQNP